MPRILERRSAAEEISRIARERHARLDAKAEAEKQQLQIEQQQSQIEQQRVELKEQ